MNGDPRGSFTARVQRDPEYRHWLLLRLYESQTPNEQARQNTRELNYRGFSAPDAAVLSRLAERVRAGASLCASQESLLKRCLPKYWSQFVSITLMEPPSNIKPPKKRPAASDDKGRERAA